MPHPIYKSLDICLHDPKIDEKLEYQKRIESSNTVFLPFTINGWPAFFVRIPALEQFIAEIMDLNAKLSKQAASISDFFSVVHSCLLEEIQMSNAIEGIVCSTFDLAQAACNQADGQILRFTGQIEQYRNLLEGSVRFPQSAPAIAKFYQAMFLQEPPAIERELFPDGKYFRKADVMVTNGIRVIHAGIQSEEKMITILEKSMSVIKNEDPLLQAALFHFVFGFVHPFYDGNGRLNRFLCALKLGEELEWIGVLQFSKILYQNRKIYYKMFEHAERPTNKGELTFFLLSYLQLLKQALQEGLTALKQA